MEYLVRQARITDIERFGALCTEMGAFAGTGSPLDPTGLLRQLVYLPNASVLIAEVQRELAGGAVLALRPSIQAGGFVGTVDLLVVGHGFDADRVTDALIEELLRSAKNKGCATVEVVLQDDALSARWLRHGFAAATAHLYKAAVADRAAASR